MSLNEIQSVAAGLPERERGELALWLLESLPAEKDNGYPRDSVEEAVRRRDELDSGQVAPITATELWESVQRGRSEWRRGLSFA